ncbi:MAG: polysaccharide deacetylase family protein [Candidatus Krumholzibacteriota bacterium]
MMRKSPVGTTIFLFLLLTAAISGFSGCGGGSDNAEGRKPAGYFLDSPTLATGGFPMIEDGVPVFCYHYFRSGFDAGYLMKVLGSVILGMPALGPREFWTTPVGEFEKHLRFFRDTGTVVMTLDEVADLVASGRDLPPRAAILTIDDADRSVYELAFPLLKKYGMKAHLFVPTAQVGKSWSELDLCTWEQLAEMEASGHVLLGSHTRDLHFKVEVDGDLEPVFFNPGQVPREARLRNLTDLSRRAGSRAPDVIPVDLAELLSGPYAAVAADLVASRVDLRTGADAGAAWLAWPYGFASDELDSLGRAAGFRGTVSLYPEAFTVRDTSLQVGRFALTAKTTVGHIANLYPR